MTQQIEPCPNCGGACRPCSSKSPWSSKWVECGNTACQYRGPISLVMDSEKDGAIALHNRIARAVREVSELSHLAGYYLARSEQAEAERDALRALIEQNNRRCEIGCKRVQDWVNCGIAECGSCPLRYIIELPKEQG